MSTTRPLIMISNDDSISAPGLHVLADVAAKYGDVWVVAPAQPHSGQSSALTVGEPLKIKELPSEKDGVRLFTVDGTPVDCIKLGLHAIMPRKPDLLLSGINHGSNSGTAIIYSGTMGAVLEGCMEQIPSVGFSLLHHSIKADFSLGLEFIDRIVAEVIQNGLPEGICLNVNIPAKVVPEGVRVCRAAKGHWSEEYQRYLDPQGNPFYWLTGRFVNEEPEATDTDEYWLQRRYISVVPVTPDMTAHSSIKPLTPRFTIR